MTPRAGATAALTAVLLAATGACSVPPKPGSNEATQQRYQRDHAVRLDLTAPRTARQLGVQAGRTASPFNRAGGPYWNYRLALPGGRLFTTPGFGHVVEVDPNPVAPTAQVLINTSADGLQAGADALLAAVPVLGLKPQEIDAWVERARRVPLTVSDSTDVRVFRGATIDYLDVDVDVRRNVANSDVVINWSFTWTPTPAAPGTTA